jgi:hypothetical protein
MLSIISILYLPLFLISRSRVHANLSSRITVLTTLLIITYTTSSSEKSSVALTNVFTSDNQIDRESHRRLPHIIKSLKKSSSKKHKKGSKKKSKDGCSRSGKSSKSHRHRCHHIVVSEIQLTLIEEDIHMI